MTDTKRKTCRYCGQPVANQHDWDTVPEGGGVGLCWGGVTCMSAEEAVDRLHAENRRLREAIWKVLNIVPTPTCDQMHHTKKEQHEYGATCPPVERVKSIIDNCKKLLA